MSAAKLTPMVVAAARELCRQHAEVCQINEHDAWTFYAEDFKAEAQRVLDACGASGLLTVAEQVFVLLTTKGVAEVFGQEWCDKALAAIRKANGSAS